MIRNLFIHTTLEGEVWIGIVVELVSLLLVEWLTNKKIALLLLKSLLKHWIPLLSVLLYSIDLPVLLVFTKLVTTCVADTVLAVVNTSLLLVVYALSDMLVTVPVLVEVIVGDVVHCISGSIHSRYSIRLKWFWHYFLLTNWNRSISTFANNVFTIDSNEV